MPSLCQAGAHPAPGPHSCRRDALGLPRRFGWPPAQEPSEGPTARTGRVRGVLQGRRLSFPESRVAVLRCAARCRRVEVWEPQSRRGWERREVSLRPLPSAARSPRRSPEQPQGYPTVPAWAGSAVPPRRTGGVFGTGRSRGKLYGIKGLLPAASRQPRTQEGL